MRRTLYLKFLLAYLIFGFFGFIAVATFVSNMTLEQLKRERADSLYKEATLIANTYASDLYNNQASLDTVKAQLDALDTYLSATIWIINPSGRIILDSSAPVNLENEVDDLEKKYQKNHVRRMSKNECSPKAAIFSDLISNFERVSDHATNIAFATFREEEYI